MVYDIDDITFWGMNIPKEVEMFVEKTKEENKKVMTETEFRAYCMGIENTIMIMEQLLQSDDGNSITFYDVWAGTSAIEYTVDDLVNIVNR